MWRTAAVQPSMSWARRLRVNEPTRSSGVDGVSRTRSGSWDTARNAETNSRTVVLRPVPRLITS